MLPVSEIKIIFHGRRRAAGGDRDLGGFARGQMRLHDQRVKALAAEYFGGRVDAIHPDGAPAGQLKQQRDGLCGVGIVVQYEDRWAALA